MADVNKMEFFTKVSIDYFLRKNFEKKYLILEKTYLIFIISSYSLMIFFKIFN